MASIYNTSDAQRIFNKLDKDGNGVISLDELMWLLEKIGFNTSPEELELLVGKNCLDPIDFFFFYDTIIKGKIDGCKLNEEDNFLEKDLLKAFEVFDSNGDGFISTEELQNALCKLGLWDEQSGKDCKSMIHVYDANCDGKLDFEEFKNMMLSCK